jgi:twinkle protein
MGKTHNSTPITTHQTCPHCPSSDAYSIFSDGHGYCYSCGTYDPSPNEYNKALERGSKSKKKTTGNLITAGEFKQLPKRKITKKTCEFFGYFINQYKGNPVHVAPYYSRKRKLIAQHLRRADKTMPWLGKPDQAVLFGQQLWNTGGILLVITEGEIDAMSISQSLNHQWPVVSIPNGAQDAARSIQENLDFVTSFEQIILAFDNDQPGLQATEDVVQLLEPGKVKIFQYPGDYKDANELLQAGQGKRIVDGVFKAPIYRPDGIIDGSELYNEVHRDPEKGYQVPYPVLQQMFYGFRKGELYLFTAGSGIGKSTLVNEIGYHFLTEHQQKIGVIALEENKRQTAKRYVGIDLNVPLTISKDNLTKEQIDTAFHRTVGSGRFFLYDHWGSVSLDNLINKFRYLAVGFQVDWIILDHISIVVSGLDEIRESERKMIDKLMTRLRSLAEETGVGIMAIVHLNRPIDQSNKSYNEGKAVTLRGLRGSGALEQFSDGVIALERNQQSEDPDVSVIRILKNRPIGKTGIADTLRYNHETGRLWTDESVSFAEVDEEDTDAF